MIEDKEEILKKSIFQHGNLQESKVLDIGFGEGDITKYISKFAKSVTAVENDKSLIPKSEGNIVYKYGNGEKLEFPENSFDSVLYIRSLHHIRKCSQSLDEAWRILKPNGIVLIIEPIYKGGAYEEIDSIYNDEKDARDSAIEAIRNSDFVVDVEKTIKIIYICKDFQDLYDSSIKNKKWKNWKETYKDKVMEILSKNKAGKRFELDYKLKLFVLKKKE